uniref:NUDIX hydrolase n=1 Tax=candidate division CPR3 bacterium TaxID=2268181 RepID=A0A7V3J9Y2_UNCC3
MANRAKKWQEVSREIVFQKYSRKIEKVIFKLPDSKESDFYIKREGPAASVLALTKDMQVILAKQYRPGPGEILFELPGGYVDPNEEPEITIERELLEETGYRGKVQLVTTCFDDAYSTMNRYCFVATGCEKISEIKTEDHEFVELELLSLDEFRKLLRSGKMTDVEVGYLGLDFLRLL